MSISAMKCALQSLESVEKVKGWNKDSVIGRHCSQSAHFLRQAIEQAEKQEPVAWAKFNQGEITHSEMTDGSGCDFDLKAAGFVPLYTAPITRQENRQVAKNATTDNQEVAKSATSDWEAVAADQAMTIAMLKLEQKREWVGLTDHELQVLDFNDPERGKLARAVEAKLKEKNG